MVSSAAPRSTCSSVPHQDVLDDARRGSGDDVLHLHRLYDQERLAGGHRLTGLYAHVEHPTGHGRAEPARGSGGPANHEALGDAKVDGAAHGLDEEMSVRGRDAREVASRVDLDVEVVVRPVVDPRPAPGAEVERSVAPALVLDGDRLVGVSR